MRQQAGEMPPRWHNVALESGSGGNLDDEKNTDLELRLTWVVVSVLPLYDFGQVT